MSLSVVTEVKKKYLPEDGQKLTETCWRILRLLTQYDHFNLLFYKVNLSAILLVHKHILNKDCTVKNNNEDGVHSPKIHFIQHVRKIYYQSERSGVDTFQYAY